MKVINLIFVVLLGLLIKCSADSFSQNMARGSLVKDLLTTLASHKTQEDKVRQDIALLSLDQFLVSDTHWWEINSYADKKKNQQFIFRIALVIFNDIQQDKTIDDSLRTRMVNVASVVMKKNDSLSAYAAINNYKKENRLNAVSNPDTAKQANSSQQQVQSVLNGLRNDSDRALVYIQIKQDDERPVARNIQRYFNSKGGYSAPGIELMPSDFHYDTSIRYYHREDKVLADTIQAVTAKYLAKYFGQRAPHVRMVNLSRKKYQAANRQVEVWINTH